MRIESNGIIYKVTGITNHRDDRRNIQHESDICPYCGLKLTLIKQTNIKVCGNPCCVNDFRKQQSYYSLDE